VNNIPKLANNYASLDSTYKWADTNDFNANAVASAAPARSSIELASGTRAQPEAVLPKKKSRIGV
jgi:hypothetical protein